VQSDLLRRHLEFRGFAVRHVMNITDVEDKIIRRVRESGQPLGEFTRRYESEFLSDLRTLNCLLPTIMPRATEFIPQIIDLISRLEGRGLA
jgi:cysteinyl-tRNA synthetase